MHVESSVCVLALLSEIVELLQVNMEMRMGSVGLTSRFAASAASASFATFDAFAAFAAFADLSLSSPLQLFLLSQPSQFLWRSAFRSLDAGHSDQRSPLAMIHMVILLSYSLSTRFFETWLLPFLHSFLHSSLEFPQAPLHHVSDPKVKSSVIIPLLLCVQLLPTSPFLHLFSPAGKPLPPSYSYR